MKTLSFIEMITSMGLITILTLLYFSTRHFIEQKETIMFVIAIVIAVFFFIVSFMTAIKFKWGDKNSYSPMF